MSVNQNDRWRTEVDQQLGVLRTEVSGIKTQLREHGETLGKIFSRLDEISGRQGPGIRHILAVMVSCVTILVFAGGAITVLVNSFVSPQITRLETRSDHYGSVVSQLLAEHVDEFRRLKELERSSLDARFRKLEEAVSKLSWAPAVNPK